MNRRIFFKWLLAGAGTVGAGHILGRYFLTVCPVTILGVPDYQRDFSRDLAKIMKDDGLILKGKTVLLKPNFVEVHQNRPINTDVRFIANVAEACFLMGAREVAVGEAAGHRRDPWFSVHHPSLKAILDKRVKCLDLNHSETVEVPNKGLFTMLRSFFIPRPISEADVFINLPKMKTHHWVGVTLSLKNLFGTVPGIVYGWPKNVLHFQGVENSILDLACTIRQDYSIIDGIIGMEGDGPILGTPKPVGAVIMGKYPLAVDTTAARIMGFNPLKTPYLSSAGLLFPGLNEESIRQQGETTGKFASPFACLASLRNFQEPDLW